MMQPHDNGFFQTEYAGKLAFKQIKKRSSMLAKKLPFTVERGVLVANEFAPPVTKTLMSIKKENKAGSTFIQTMGRKWD